MTALQLQLLGDFGLASRASAPTMVLGRGILARSDRPPSAGAQRLVALLALRGRSMSRIAVAEALWPGATSIAGAERLRAALSRLDPLSRSAVIGSSRGLTIAEDCAIDYWVTRDCAIAVIDDAHDARLHNVSASAAVTRQLIAAFSLRLLPDWYDDWVLDEAEDWRMLRLDALETLAHAPAGAIPGGMAFAAARAATRYEPLRETAHAALISLHIRVGNAAEAVAVYEDFRRALADALHVRPSESLRALMTPEKARELRGESAVGNIRDVPYA